MHCIQNWHENSLCLCVYTVCLIVHVYSNILVQQRRQSMNVRTSGAILLAMPTWAMPHIILW